MLDIEFKKKLLKEVKKTLNDKISGYNLMLANIDEAKEGEEKNSSGDKYETSIEMLKQERNKIDIQLVEAFKMKSIIERMPLTKNKNITFGSIVKTKNKTLFVSIPIGKIIVSGKEILCISSLAPVYNLIKNKQVGESYTLNTETNQILEIF